jgi:DMSO/TMAO reductase YedYZ molybdopterin-dependent catalytic subunit
MGPPQRVMKLQPHELTDRVTPARDLFVLAHLGVPQVDPTRWTLSVDGLVRQPFTLDLARLQALPKREVEAVHQCCGSPLEPFVPTRRVSNVRWGGADLAALLDQAGIESQARFLWSFGLDGGTFAGQPCDWYLKDLPLDRVQAGDVLLAYELNGEPLAAEHGFPVRLVVPGYYGTNSVKWLWRLHPAAGRAPGLFTTTFYNDPPAAADDAAGVGGTRPVWATAPESVIVAPAPGAALRAGREAELWGWAWSLRGIAAAEISLDDGRTWETAELEPPRGWTWQRFRLRFRPERTGPLRLLARAREAGGQSQPRDGARNAMHAVEVTVLAPA